MKRYLLLLFTIFIAFSCEKDEGIKKSPVSVAGSRWLADTGSITPQSDYFIMDFREDGTVELCEAEYSSRDERGWEYVFRNPLLGGKAYYNEAKGTYTQREKSITFNLTATGERAFGFPSAGIHTITFTSGEVVGAANIAMDVYYDTEKESGEKKNGTLKFIRQ